MERIISLVCALFLVIAMPKHRIKHVADQAIQTTLPEERWAMPTEKFESSVERIRNLSAEMYKELMKGGSMLWELNEFGDLPVLAGMWAELHNHELEIENAKTSLKEQMVLIGQSTGLLKYKNRNGFTSSSFNIPLPDITVEVDLYDKGHILESQRENFYNYVKKHGFDITSFTVPSLYLHLKAARQGSSEAKKIIDDLASLNIAELETVESVRQKVPGELRLRLAKRE